MGPSAFDYTGGRHSLSEAYGLCRFFPPEGGGGGAREYFPAVQPVSRKDVDVALFVLAE